MYLQVTTRCNMFCPHCCYRCGPEGEDMSIYTVKKALELIEDRDDMICIGGGEPTIHPQFWEILGLCLSVSPMDCGPFIVTNGKEKETAITLAKLAWREVIGADLSLDPFHEPIDPEVVHAFSRESPYRHFGRSRHDFNGPMDKFRDVSINIANAGRARDDGMGTDNHCVCDDLFVAPNGDIFSCGCQVERFGTVWEPDIPEAYYERDSFCPNECEEEVA